MTNDSQIAFQSVQLPDAALIFAWRRRPHVARWWNIQLWEVVVRLSPSNRKSKQP